MNNSSNNGISVLLTGATGMVGEGVLHECLRHPGIAKVTVINRRPCGVTDPKLEEIIHNDFFNLLPLRDKLKGFDACFFCLGVSSVGMKEPVYYRLTYTLTLHMAELLAEGQPGMIFCYVSGAGTDSTEKGRSMWARVKGKTENDLMKLPFKRVYNFRPGILTPTPGLHNTLGFYKYLGWLIPVVKAVAPNTVSSLKELGLAMIKVATVGYEKQIIEVSDIHKLGQ
ncbi:MAG TPA: NAD-dependent epimerase/dehydratase family protein [Chitinophagaceae bacterium]|nr:NAD-dependent epimerase/dehydratase family protein [Chitinophagaceae bacterium]